MGPRGEPGARTLRGRAARRILAARGLPLVRCSLVIAGFASRRCCTRLGPLLLALGLGMGGSACQPTRSGAGEGEAAGAGANAGTEAKAPPPSEPAPKAELPAAEGILERAAAAMGSKEAIDRVESFYYRGTIEVLGQNIHGDLEIWWKGGDFFMEQVVPGLGRMRAGKQGDEIWAEDPVNGLRRLSGVEAEQHAWASSLLLAAEWRRYFQSAETIAAREVDGRTIHDVELSAPSGLRVVMSFDAESGLQVGQSFEQVTPMGKQPFEVRFEDYREVEGIKLAYRQVIDAKVQQVVQVITEVRLNAPVDPAKLAYPRTGSDLVRQPEPSPAAAG
jgi:hypothetical protein